MSTLKDKTGIEGGEKKFTLSTDPNTAMQEMMSTIDQMRGVYTVETHALENSDTKTFLEIQQQKLEVARKYQEGVEQILARGPAMKSANPLLKKRLLEMQQEFATLSVKNIDAIKRMQRVTERLGDTIRGAAKEAARRQRAFSYGESGALQTSDKKSISMGVSETA